MDPGAEGTGGQGPGPDGPGAGESEGPGTGAGDVNRRRTTPNTPAPTPPAEATNPVLSFQEMMAQMMEMLMPMLGSMFGSMNEAMGAMMEGMSAASIPQFPEIEVPEPIDFEEQEKTLQQRLSGQRLVDLQKKYGMGDTLHSPLLLDDPSTTDEGNLSGILV